MSDKYSSVPVLPSLVERLATLSPELSVTLKAYLKGRTGEPRWTWNGDASSEMMVYLMEVLYCAEQARLEVMEDAMKARNDWKRALSELQVSRMSAILELEPVLIQTCHAAWELHLAMHDVHTDRLPTCGGKDV